MRENIEFRGQVKYNGKHLLAGDWAYGSLIIKSNGIFIYVIERDELGTIIREFEVEVIPETIGQYTGIIDKNGVKVFEGDLLKIKETEFNIEGVHEVYYHKDGYVTSSVLFSNKDNAIKNCLQYQIRHKEAYVIGNKHNNPELLKK